MQFDLVVRYGTHCPKTGYSLRLGEPVLSRTLRHFFTNMRCTLILFPWLVFILVLPILWTLAINKYPRNAILETWSHWISEQRNATAVFCGDSLVAGGGHWGPRVGLGYFTTRNLAGNGYTIRQTISQVKKANIYQPKYISVAAGTNDAFSILNERQTIENSILDLSKLINST
ncbi:MAG: SGNH/GDSL hydrolase family protein, partial [Moorea sp. SIO4G2]|nr:SGNH/GDSL hydrolase family protein [Moorena sp. SIO4G2]